MGIFKLRLWNSRAQRLTHARFCAAAAVARVALSVVQHKHMMHQIGQLSQRNALETQPKHGHSSIHSLDTLQ